MARQGIPPVLRVAFALALGAAVSLGLARFAYALLLPAMREELGWSYLTAGALNTANAAGYLVGALIMPWALRRHSARDLMLVGVWSAAALLACHAWATDTVWLMGLRGLTGVASALTFVGGGLLATRWSVRHTGQTPLARFVLGIFYGGVGLGIVLASLSLPPWLALGVGQWRGAWLGLAALALVAGGILQHHTRALSDVTSATGTAQPWHWPSLWPGLVGYFCFGLGYIGYMTFSVSLLREQAMSEFAVAGFFALLGVGVMASSWLWARPLSQWRGGQTMALLNGLLALATALPVFTLHPVAVYVSGALFGAVFLGVVASSTALVRHNLMPGAWPSGISAFTMVFAAGQVLGPSWVGWVADGRSGLAGGFLWSAGVLLLGAMLAALQRPLTVGVGRAAEPLMQPPPSALPPAGER